ncbi:hypothetical protein EYF80_030929 [Liparis tanakae]|uniref:Uncharacterized protein n=1 Tax=Liparis tanakae TaxID=230148 RepID=A0A4Z2GZA4_9TELE|nr:hypothetical protein EYF80_030929 [Liparis tanakae]
MQLALEKCPLSYRGSEIHIYADYSAEVAKKRATVSPVKSALRKAGYQFSLIFPAKLRVIVDGTRHEFNTSGEAASFLENIQNIQPAGLSSLVWPLSRGLLPQGPDSCPSC